jgi:hypothetical protein
MIEVSAKFGINWVLGDFSALRHTAAKQNS